MRPIEVHINPDHLTVEFNQLEVMETELYEKFQKAKPENVTDEVVEMHGKSYMMLYGTQEELFQFLWNVTQDFDLLLV